MEYEYSPPTFTMAMFPEEGATLRTDVAPNMGSMPRNGFDVDFQLLYEVHGAYDPGDKDNASLLVLRMIPLPRKKDMKFSKLRVQLSVKLVDAEASDADEDLPTLESFEPASQGSEFFDVFRTNKEQTSGYTGNITGSFGPPASATVGLSRQNKSSFQEDQLLSVRAKAVNVEPMLRVDKNNGAYWEINSATKRRGIGDSFTVAMLIKRPTGSSFQLVAEGEGYLGTFLETLANFTGATKLHERPPYRLTTLPRNRVPTRIPAGVRPDNLHRASTDNIIRQIPEVGLHLPEWARPVTADPNASSSTSMDIDKMLHRKKASAKDEYEGEDENEDKDENNDEDEDKDEDKDDGEDDGDDGNTEEVGLDETLELDASVLATATSTRTSIAQRSATAAAPTTTMSLSGDGLAHRVDSPGQDNPALAATLAVILQEVRRLGRLSDHQQDHEASSAAHATASLSARRVQRLRETASLYERLAELHREEARELLALEK